MFWRTIFKRDLASQIEKWKRRYNGDDREFNFRSIWISTTKWSSGQYTAAAGAFCRDPNVTGFDMSNTLWFYRSAQFQTEVEAEAHIIRELRQASWKHKQSDFHRSRKVDFLELNGKIERDITIFEFFRDGDWQAASEIPGAQKCRGCGRDVNSDICGYCGEPTFF